MQTSPDPQSRAVRSIEDAIAHLADALVEIDRIPAHDRSTIGSVAHAMNNYLTVTEATLDLLSHALEGHQDPEVATWLTGLRHLGSMMQHAIGRLLYASSADDFPLKPEYVDLAKLMERACVYYRPIAEGKRLRLRASKVGEVPMAWADRVAVAVIADNLLSNAVKFSNPGGEITVQTQPGPGGVMCSVRDQGLGLSQLEQSRLFQRGVTMGPAATASEPSSGFGLALSRELVDRMGGRLWCDSEKGLGATFTFRLPYHP